MKLFIALLALTLFTSTSHANHPDCKDSKGWARSVGYLYYNKSRLLQEENFDHTRSIVTRLASEKVSDNLFRQVHHFSYTKKNGDTISFIITNKASFNECPVDSIDAYVISEEFVYDN